MARRVAITGIGGLVGRALTARLLEDPEVERIVGLDVAPPTGLSDSDRVELHGVDVRDPGLASHLEGCDVVVHLAFMMDEPRDRELMRSVNVDGSRNVATAAAAVGARTFVYPSSVVAYGAHPDNDMPLTEDSPLRANPDFAYGEHKREVEEWLAEWSQDQGLSVTILRPSMVAGKGVDNFFIRQFFSSPRLFMVRGHRRLWQFTHLDDLVSAIELAIGGDLPGAYNVASEGWLSTEEFLELTGQRVIELPAATAYSIAERMWRMDLAGGPPGAVHYLMHPWVLGVDKLRAAGWNPKHTNRDCVQEIQAEQGTYVTLKHNVRVERRTVRRAVGVSAALLALLAAGALASRDRD